MYFPKTIHIIFIFISIIFLYCEFLSADVDMQVSPAYDNYHKQYKWLALNLLLINNDGEFNGEVAVEIQSYNAKDTYIYSAPVSLFGNARKSKCLYVYPESIQSSINVKLKDKQGNSIIEKDLQLEVISPEDRLIAIVDENKRVNLPPIDNKIHFSKITPEKLPDEWKGYDPLDSVIIGKFSDSLFSDKQKKALIKWLYCGGTLIVSGGMNTQSLKDSFINELLPVEIDGTKVINSISALGISGTPVVVSSSKLKESGKIVLADDEMPVISEKKVGSGRCVFICFDYGDPLFRSLLLGNDFWDKIMPDSAKPIDVKYNNISRMIAKQSNAGLPSYKFIGGFWLMYVLCLAIPGYIIIKKTRKKEIVWLFVFVIIFVFVLSSLVFSYTISKKSLVINDFSIAEIYQDAKIARLKSYFNPLSFIKSGLELNFSEAFFAEKPFSADSGSYWKGNLVSDQDDNYQLNIIKMRFQPSQFLYGESVLNFDGKIGLDVANLRIKNSTKFDIANCLIIMDGRYSQINSLENNSETKIKFTEEYSENFFDSYNLEDNIRKTFFNAVKSSLYSKVSDKALIGWIDGSALKAFANMEANRTYKPSGMALIIINL